MQKTLQTSNLALKKEFEYLYDKCDSKYKETKLDPYKDIRNVCNENMKE